MCFVCLFHPWYQWSPLPLCLLILQQNIETKNLRLTKQHLSNWLDRLVNLKFDPQFLLAQIELLSLCISHKVSPPSFFTTWQQVQSELESMQSLNPDIIVALLSFLNTFQTEFLPESNQFPNSEKIFEIGFWVKQYVNSQLTVLAGIESWASDHWNFNPVTLFKLSGLTILTDSTQDTLNNKIKECFEDPFYLR